MRLVLVASLVTLACAAPPQPAPQADAPRPASPGSSDPPAPTPPSADAPAPAPEPTPALEPSPVPQDTSEPPDTSPEPASPVLQDTSEPTNPSPDLDAATLAALARRAGGKLQALIHPKLGVYLVHNMSGSVPHLVHQRRWPKEDGWWLEPRFVSEGILADLAAAETWAASYRPPLTEGECDKGSSQLRPGPTDSLGHVLDIHLGMREMMDDEEDLPPWLERSFAELQREGHLKGTDLSLDAATWRRLQRLGAAASHHVFLEHHGLVEFGQIDGRWYLLGIDNTDDACG